MNISRSLLLGLTAVVSLALAGEAQAESGGVKVGILTCIVASGWGLIFGSSKDLNCTFAPGPARAENHFGKINKYGVDIG